MFYFDKVCGNSGPAKVLLAFQNGLSTLESVSTHHSYHSRVEIFLEIHIIESTTTNRNHAACCCTCTSDAYRNYSRRV